MVVLEFMQLAQLSITYCPSLAFAWHEATLPWNLLYSTASSSEGVNTL